MEHDFIIGLLPNIFQAPAEEIPKKRVGTRRANTPAGIQDHQTQSNNLPHELVVFIAYHRLRDDWCGGLGLCGKTDILLFRTLRKRRFQLICNRLKVEFILTLWKVKTQQGKNANSQIIIIIPSQTVIN